ncbi:MAG TPA: D-glycero-beta-D-manno-heptose 1-phosphate adenylyltransferase [Syntrophales bacterium]|nr:D-glycero-beta-D-manno-heptose 1-phosphate adenylyltransferase [Syntrophales bacterium]
MGAEKIVSRKTLLVLLKEHRRQGRRIVFTNGCFDILHAGHVRYLAQARRLGDVLVVALNTDRSVRSIKGPDRPVVRQEERAFVMAGLESVDYVTFFDDETPLSLIEALQPDILVKGGDWKADGVVGGDFVRSKGGDVVVLPYLEGASTTNIIEKIRRSS